MAERFSNLLDMQNKPAAEKESSQCLINSSDSLTTGLENSLPLLLLVHLTEPSLNSAKNHSLIHCLMCSFTVSDSVPSPTQGTRAIEKWFQCGPCPQGPAGQLGSGTHREVGEAQWSWRWTGGSRSIRGPPWPRMIEGTCSPQAPGWLGSGRALEIRALHFLSCFNKQGISASSTTWKKIPPAPLLAVLPFSSRKPLLSFPFDPEGCMMLSFSCKWWCEP